jgi:hypothetical protein
MLIDTLPPRGGSSAASEGTGSIGTAIALASATEERRNARRVGLKVPLCLAVI